jgi:hypothetical protein
MKSSSRVIPLLATGFSCGLLSCASISDAGRSSLAFVKNTTTAATTKVSQLSTMAVEKINPPSVRVVEVREKDLKPLPTGHERALAHENTRKRSFWIFSGPVDFKEPTLPEPGGDMDGSLLPPKAP